MHINTYGLLTKLVRSRLFVCINTKKKERDQYPTILSEQAWSIKELLYDFFRALKRKPVACTINGGR